MTANMCAGAAMGVGALVTVDFVARKMFGPRVALPHEVDADAFVRCPFGIPIAVTAAFTGVCAGVGVWMVRGTAHPARACGAVVWTTITARSAWETAQHAHGAYQQSTVPRVGRDVAFQLYQRALWRPLAF